MLCRTSADLRILAYLSRAAATTTTTTTTTTPTCLLPFQMMCSCAAMHAEKSIENCTGRTCTSVVAANAEIRPHIPPTTRLLIYRQRAPTEDLHLMLSTCSSTRGAHISLCLSLAIFRRAAVSTAMKLCEAQHTTSSKEHRHGEMSPHSTRKSLQQCNEACKESSNFSWVDVAQDQHAGHIRHGEESIVSFQPCEHAEKRNQDQLLPFSVPPKQMRQVGRPLSKSPVPCGVILQILHGLHGTY